MKTTDWEEIKTFYCSCRSYKKTAERFGLPVATINARAYRENWKECAICAAKCHAGDAISTLQSGHADNAKCNVDAMSTLQEGQADNAKCNADAMSTLQKSHEELSALLPLPALPNLASQEVRFCHPWEEPVIKRGLLASKAAYHSYIARKDTKDCLFSGVRATSPRLRVARENPPAAMLAVVADYDAILTSGRREKLLGRLKIKPNFLSVSYSGGTHAVWMLETPIPIMPDSEMIHGLLRLIAKELKLNNAFGPLDERAFYNPSQYYHAGWEWQVVETAPIPETRCLSWFRLALEQCQWGNRTPSIPLERVQKEMEKRYPGRWQGDFSLGARGVRFWDAAADNPTAAIVTEGGMVCFTGPFAWRSWADIFGQQFIEQYRDDTLGQALKECYFVGNSYYVLTRMRKPDGSLVPTWQQLNRQNVEGLIALKYNLRTRAEKGEKQSEAKKLLAEVIRTNTMSAALPLIYRKETTTMLNGAPVLNTSFLRVHSPDENRGEHWGDGFPWVAAFLEGLFPDIIQRERFMSSWAYTYRNAYAGHPKNGHILFIAGAPGVGKNFLTECLYGPSLGGYADASEYLLGRTRFNASLFDCGVWTCNDTVTKGDDRERVIFSQSLKKLAANMRHIWEGKYKEAASLDWSGRVCVTLNTDPMSLAILPDIDINNKDKISLFLTSEERLEDASAVQHAKRELGALCSYLLHADIPGHCQGDSRWGVRNYLHPDLYSEAANSGSTASFGEILALFAKGMFDADGRLEALEGSATWFLQQMLEQDSLKEKLRGTVNARSIGRRMGALASSGSFPLDYSRNTTQRIWLIARYKFEQYLEKGNKEGELDELCPF